MSLCTTFNFVWVISSSIIWKSPVKSLPSKSTALTKELQGLLSTPATTITIITQSTALRIIPTLVFKSLLWFQNYIKAFIDTVLFSVQFYDYYHDLCRKEETG